MDKRSILLAACAIPAAIVIVLLLAFHQRGIRTEELKQRRAAQIAASLASAMRGADADAIDTIVRVAGTLQVDIAPVASLPADVRPDTPLAAHARQQLAGQDGVAVRGETVCIEAGNAHCRALLVSVGPRGDYLLAVHMPADLIAPLPVVHLVAYLAGLSLIIMLLTFAIARHSMRPLRQLAQAATRLGADLDAVVLPVEGSAVARHAAAAFNSMQTRIRAQVQHRTHMLAAITHDLQTPLTRLRLRVEKVADASLRERLVDDLGMVQEMVRNGLDLARSMESAEPRHLLDIDSLVDSLCADASEAGMDVQSDGRSHAFVMAQATQLRRCLDNLVSNAVKYGGRARLVIGTRDENVTVAVRDDGPGIPEERLAEVFDPFVRLEPSRSRDTGGTGLGLTIARNVALGHGGSLTLANRSEGGLEARLTLPVMRYRQAA